MFLKFYQKLLLVAAAGLVIAGTAGVPAQGAESDSARTLWRRAAPLEPAHRARREAAHWRTTDIEVAQRPPERLACVTLACPGYILLGVGF